MPVDQERVAKAVREILEAVGDDPEREGLRDTPDRVARMYAEVLSGIGEDPSIELTFDADHDEMVMVRDIPFASVCEHHLIPFIGRAHVAYIPNSDGRITGLSKLARLVDGFARRPQVQERLTSQVAESLVDRRARHPAAFEGRLPDHQGRIAVGEVDGHGAIRGEGDQQEGAGDAER